MEVTGYEGNGIRITDAQVHGLSESMAAAYLPMMHGREEYSDRLDGVEEALGVGIVPDRPRTLASYGPGEGHNCYLVGINVQANITAPRYWWHQLQRYHFVEIVSSMSTMHRLGEGLDALCAQRQLLPEHYDFEQYFSSGTDSRIVDLLLDIWEDLRDNTGMSRNERLLVIKPNLPEGWLQTARISTNYRQLKSIVYQRSDHRLKEWKGFCSWCREMLPCAELLATTK